MNRLSPAVLGLVIANAAVYVVGLVLPEARAWLVEHGAFWFTGNPHYGPWQFVTYMFLHSSPSPGHIFFNMFALVSFGGLLEQQWGTRRFLVFYILCGVGAALVHNGMNAYHCSVLQEHLIAQGLTPEEIRAALTSGRSAVANPEIKATLIELYRAYAVPMLGASGGIYGVLVAFGLLYPNAKLALMFLPVPIAAKFFIPILLSLDLLSGVTGFSLFGGGIAHFAHLGGALVGLLLMLLWRRGAQRDPAQREAERFRP